MTAPASKSETAERESRRGFIDLLLGVSVAGWIATILYPVLAFLKPLPYSGPTGPVHLTRDERGRLEEDGFVIVPVSGKRALVFRDASGGVRAMDAKCTHEACTVRFVSAESMIWCACHNGKFDVDGNVISGPPPRPLPRFTVAEGKDGTITVSSEA